MRVHLMIVLASSWICTWMLFNTSNAQAQDIKVLDQYFYGEIFTDESGSVRKKPIVFPISLTRFVLAGSLTSNLPIN
jgi:hypothetical protein